MAITLLAANALTTNALVRKDLKLSSTDEDPTIEVLINIASTLIENSTKRRFQYSAVIVEKVAGFGTEKLLVQRTPIDEQVAIAITFDGTVVDSDNFEIESAKGGIIRNKYSVWNWTGRSPPNIAPTFLPGTERKLYQVTYAGGYILPNDSAVSGVELLPDDLNFAARQLAVSLYRGLPRDHAIESERLMSYAVKYRKDANAIPPLVETVIKTYRRYH